MFLMCPYCADGCKCGRKAYSEGTCIYCGHGIPRVCESYAEHAARHIRTTGSFDARAIAMIDKPRTGRAKLGRRSVWDASAILAAIRAWARDTGRPPTMRDWNKSESGHPCTNTVVRIFGSWADGVAAAGFPKPHRGRPSPTTDLRIAA